MGFMKNRVDIRNESKIYTLQNSEFLKILGIDTNNINQSKFGEIVYYICLQHLVTTMSKMPRYLYQETNQKGKEKIKQTMWNNILNREPNPYYTASTLWGSVELNKLHYGNAYIYIENVTSKIKYLWLIPSDEIAIYIDNAGIFDYGISKKAKSKNNAIWYVWTDSKSGKKYTFNMDEILHFKTHMSLDGITGMAVKDILKTQIDSLKYSQAYQGKLYKNNMFGGKAILQYTGSLDSTAKDTLITETERYANSVGSGAFLPLPLGITATPLDMKLSDAEYVELNKLSALQLAACFGIKPNILNDYSKSSYSNSETQQLDFYVNSLQPIFKMYNDEKTKKLLTRNEKDNNYFFEIDKEVLFELDKKTQMEILTKGVNNFILTSNEAREKLGFSYIDNPNANMLIGNGNYIRLDQIGTQWNNNIPEEGGENVDE